MTKERIFEHYDFMDKFDVNQINQLSVFDESVYSSLDEENVDKIVQFLSEYDIEMTSFFPENVDSFIFSFENEFRPAWLALVSKYNTDLVQLLNNELVLYDEIANILQQL